jgi:hypothetical protein
MKPTMQPPNQLSITSITNYQLPQTHQLITLQSSNSQNFFPSYDEAIASKTKFNRVAFLEQEARRVKKLMAKNHPELECTVWPEGIKGEFEEVTRTCHTSQWKIGSLQM